MSTTSIQEYSVIEANLEALKSRHLNVVIDVTTAEGMKKAKEGRSELREMRLSLEDIRQRTKEPLLKLGKELDSEAKRIQAVLNPMEESYDRAIKTEEKKAEDEKQAKIKAAQEVEAERQRLAREEEDRKAKAEREEIARQQKEAQDKIDADNKRLADDRVAFEAEKKAAEDKRLTDEKASRDRIESAERESRQKLEAEQKKIQEIEDKKARDAKEIKDKEENEARIKKDKEESDLRAARKIKDDAEREVQRLENLRLDGYQILQTFIDRYGAMPEFKVISNSIDSFLVDQKVAV